MRIIIRNSSEVAIYQQIYDQIKEAILKKQIMEGDVLPSIRQLARELKVSVITTTRAYTDLEKDGYIVIMQGKGCFVKAMKRTQLEEMVLTEFERCAREAIHQARILKKQDEEIIEMFTMIMEDKDGAGD